VVAFKGLPDVHRPAVRRLPRATAAVEEAVGVIEGVVADLLAGPVGTTAPIRLDASNLAGGTS
jgi:hypothetical protein